MGEESSLDPALPRYQEEWNQDPRDAHSSWTVPNSGDYGQAPTPSNRIDPANAVPSYQPAQDLIERPPVSQNEGLPDHSIFYYRSFPRDGRVKKLIVLLLNIAELAQTLALSNMFWDVLICNKLPKAGGGASLDKSLMDPWQMKLSFVIIAVISLFVQGFFCLRVWRVSLGNVALFAVISISSLAQFIAMIYLTDTDDMIRDSENFQPGPTNNWLFSLGMLGNIICDGTVAGSLTYYFRSYRTGMPRTEPVMQQLILLSTSTGLLLCLLTASAWALAQINPHHSSNCLVPILIVGNLYVNSMMANLNSRRHFRAVVERTIDYSMHASAFDASRLAME
ncbi:hypothetical protein FIBSPDRAFT_961001 [Athelia psychrophila]|uniref:DUF6534 domain-containing protein n=1 Tax=Athelia psychrophila TaxID=1759441 RepID=A0A166BSV3_9AGAM|nr:hypothetical protein FIBSPDRAFT_961001 [Fibularhizoctonia sp. CBS 109695]